MNTVTLVHFTVTLEHCSIVTLKFCNTVTLCIEAVESSGQVEIITKVKARRVMGVSKEGCGKPIENRVKKSKELI